MIESMLNNQSPTSLSLEDLTSLSSISSLESTSIYSNNHSTVSSGNESRLKKNISLSQINCDLENISTSSSCSPSPTVDQSLSSSSSSSSSSPSPLSALINQRLRQKMKMFNIHPDNLRKSYKKVTFNSEQRDGRTIDIVKEIIEKQSISHKSLPTHNMETPSEWVDIADGQPKKSEFLQSMKSQNQNEAIVVNPSDVSSVSSIEVAPSTIKQFKYMIEKQKSYLDCLQRELNRLQRMENVLSELHYKSELQKRVIDNQSFSNCCEGNCKNCTCQSLSNQNDQPQQQDTNPKPTENEPVEDSISDISIVESVVSVVTPIDQTSDVTCSVDNSQAASRLRPKSNDRIHSIHAQIDQMINKLHEETVTKHSVGVQTTDFLVEPKKSYQPPPTAITKSANNNKLISRTSTRETLERPVAWTIIVEDNPFKIPKHKKNRGQAYYLKEDDEQTSDLTLQQAFRAKCGHILARSQARARQINVASAIRKATAELRLERQLEEFILRNQLPRRDYHFLTGYRSDKVKLIKPRKIFTEKEMKQQTLRLYSDLPEIKKRKEDKRKEENVKTHRMMAKNFSQRLKCKAVEGKTTFPLTLRLTN